VPCFLLGWGGPLVLCRGGVGQWDGVAVMVSCGDGVLRQRSFAVRGWGLKVLIGGG